MDLHLAHLEAQCLLNHELELVTVKNTRKNIHLNHNEDTRRGCIHSLPHEKILDSSKLIAFANKKKINVTQKLKFKFMNGGKHCRKRRKCWFPALSPFPTMFSKGFSYRSFKVVIVWSRVISLPHDKMKDFADDKINGTQNLKFGLGRLKKKKNKK